MATLPYTPAASASKNLLVRKFPPEILANICKFLDEASLASFSRVAKPLRPEAQRALYLRAGADPLRGQHVLLWAADNGQSRVLKHMLRLEIDANASYNSFLTKSRLEDVFAAQGVTGAVRPKNDRHLEEEIEREATCRESRLVYTRGNHRLFYSERIQQQHGPIEEGAQSVGGRQQYWWWGALHLAIYRGDETAVRLLLEHRANVHQPCSGLCDCLVPTYGEDSERRYQAPGRQHTIWTPLHISICRGYPEITKMLLDHELGVKILEVGDCRLDLGIGKSGDMTAFHTAAIEGLMDALRLLLERHPGARTVNRTAKLRYTALEMAALSGHINTIVRELCVHPGRFQFGKGLKNPLADLCERQMIDEAVELFDLLEELRRSGEMKARIDYRTVYNTALWHLCNYEQIHVVKFGGRGSLRATQDREVARAKKAGLVLAKRNCPAPRGDESVDGTGEGDTSDQNAATASQEVTLTTRVPYEEEMAIQWDKMEAFKPARVQLAKDLLRAGADPNFAKPHSRWGPPLDSCLKVAIRAGFLEMVELLLKNGARVDFRGYNPEDQAPMDGEEELVNRYYERYKQLPIWTTLKDDGPHQDDTRLGVFCILLENGGLDGLSVAAKENMYMKAARLNWAVGAWEKLDRYFSMDNLSNDLMIEMMEKVASCCQHTREIKDEALEWLIFEYAERLAGPASAAQRRLCEAMDHWASKMDEREGNEWDVERRGYINRLVYKIGRFLLANATATISVEE